MCVEAVAASAPRKSLGASSSGNSSGSSSQAATPGIMLLLLTLNWVWIWVLNAKLSYVICVFPLYNPTMFLYCDLLLHYMYSVWQMDLSRVTYIFMSFIQLG